jgi:hypothetical protein
MNSSVQAQLATTDAAAEIIRLHAEILAAARTTIQKAIRIGELLLQEKQRVGHGKWLPWIKANVGFSERTVRNYIRVYDNRDRLKSANVADLSDAYALLARHKPDELPDAPKSFLERTRKLNGILS